MSTAPGKIVIGRRPSTKNEVEYAAYMTRRRAEATYRRFMCAALIKWERGFSVADAPPHLNEWTRTR